MQYQAVYRTAGEVPGGSKDASGRVRQRLRQRGRFSVAHDAKSRTPAGAVLGGTKRFAHE